jgi:hypothetical protein
MSGVAACQKSINAFSGSSAGESVYVYEKHIKAGA